MTAAQRSRFYFPAWSAVAKARGWAKNITDVPMPTASPEINQLLNAVYDLAELYAQAAHRAFIPDDFRHACHVVALGRDKSSNSLSNDECERVVALFRILANPDDLASMMAWNSPDESRRRRMLWWINHNCVESYVVAVTREKFGTDELAHLTFAQLTQLHMTLKNRSAARRSKLPSPISDLQPSGDPF